MTDERIKKEEVIGWMEIGERTLLEDFLHDWTVKLNEYISKGFEDVTLQQEWDYETMNIRISGSRWETDAEYTKRIERKRRYAEKRAQARATKEEKERAQLVNLLKKYPDEERAQLVSLLKKISQARTVDYTSPDWEEQEKRLK